MGYHSSTVNAAQAGLTKTTRGTVPMPTNGAASSRPSMRKSSPRADGSIRFLDARDVLDPELLGHCQLTLDGYSGIISLTPGTTTVGKLGPELAARCRALLAAVTDETRSLYFPGARMDATAWRRTWALALRKMGYTQQSIADALGFTQVWVAKITGPGWGDPTAFTRKGPRPKAKDDPEALALGMGCLLDRFGKRKDPPRVLAWRMKISEGSLKRRAMACGRVVRALQEMRP